MTTILGALQSADYNLSKIGNTGMMGAQMAASQVHNVVTLLNKGYSLYDDINELLGKVGCVDDVPEKEDTL